MAFASSNESLQKLKTGIVVCDCVRDLQWIYEYDNAASRNLIAITEMAKELMLAICDVLQVISAATATTAARASGARAVVAAHA